ncbi:MAG TPA: hypothetical protein ENI27_00070, partial [bacterium]|nr:hypothetical protein [bacterium]
MNILLVNSEGPDAVGLRVMRDAVQQYWKDAKITTIVPRDADPWGSITMRHPNLYAIQQDDLEKREPGFFIVDGCSASDVVDLAFLRQDWFGPPNKSLDLVCMGVTA